MSGESHPEIPANTNYCGDCPHWRKTEKGASCDLVNEEHTRLCPYHLLWDGCKTCGIGVRHPTREVVRQIRRTGGTLETCPCGKEVQVWRTTLGEVFQSRTRKENAP